MERGLVLLDYVADKVIGFHEAVLTLFTLQWFNSIVSTGYVPKNLILRGKEAQATILP